MLFYIRKSMRTCGVIYLYYENEILCNHSSVPFHATLHTSRKAYQRSIASHCNVLVGHSFLHDWLKVRKIIASRSFALTARQVNFTRSLGKVT